MSSRIQYETWLVVLGLVTGAWLMLAYDTLRVFRLAIHHDPIWTGIGDFLYWLYTELVISILLYEQSDEVFRVYVIGGIFVGTIPYDRFISRIFFKCLRKVSKCLKMIVNRDKPGGVCNRGRNEVSD